MRGLALRQRPPAAVVPPNRQLQSREGAIAAMGRPWVLQATVSGQQAHLGALGDG